jgi:hypothetical protein
MILTLKLAFPVAAVFASAALLFPSVASAALTPTDVTIRGPQGDFYGKVKSERPRCVRDRKVKVYKAKSSGDLKIATDMSNDDGEWSVGTTGYKNGRFYAKATRTDDCKAGLSKIIKLIDGEVQ